MITQNTIESFYKLNEKIKENEKTDNGKFLYGYIDSAGNEFYTDEPTFDEDDEDLVEFEDCRLTIDDAMGMMGDILEHLIEEHINFSSYMNYVYNIEDLTEIRRCELFRDFTNEIRFLTAKLFHLNNKKILTIDRLEVSRLTKKDQILKIVSFPIEQSKKFVKRNLSFIDDANANFDEVNRDLLFQTIFLIIALKIDFIEKSGIFVAKHESNIKNYYAVMDFIERLVAEAFKLPKESIDKFYIDEKIRIEKEIEKLTTSSSTSSSSSSSS